MPSTEGCTQPTVTSYATCNSTFWQMVIKGVVIIAAAIIDLVQKDQQNNATLAARLK